MQAEERFALHASLVRHLPDVVTVVDAEGVVRFVNDASRREHGHPPQEAAGREALSFVHPDDRALALERRRWLLGGAGRTSSTVLRVRQADGSYRHVETHGVNLLDDPSVQGLLYVTRDVEDRARAEVMLVHALGAQSIVADLGVRALGARLVDEVLDDGLQRATSLLGVPYATLLLLDADGRLRVRLQVGPDPLPAGHAWPVDGTQAGWALRQRHPVIVEHLTAEERFGPTHDQAVRGIVCGVDVVLPGPEGPLGVLGAHGTTPRLFGPVDVQFLQGVANVLAGALVRAQVELPDGRSGAVA